MRNPMGANNIATSPMPLVNAPMTAIANAPKVTLSPATKPEKASPTLARSSCD